MPDFQNAKLGERVAKLGVIDNYIRTAGGTLLAMVTCSVQTSPEGVVYTCISIDLVLEDGISVNTTPLGAYPLAQQDKCIQDGRLLADHLHLSMRIATPTVGWQHVRVDEQPPEPELPVEDFVV